ncbi:hypothetical protein [Streptomyces sp. WG7]
MFRDNLNTRLAAGLKRYEAEHDWLATVRLVDACLTATRLSLSTPAPP